MNEYAISIQHNCKGRILGCHERTQNMLLTQSWQLSGSLENWRVSQIWPCKEPRSWFQEEGTAHKQHGLEGHPGALGTQCTWKTHGVEGGTVAKEGLEPGGRILQTMRRCLESIQRAQGARETNAQQSTTIRLLLWKSQSVGTDWRGARLETGMAVGKTAQ